jgi:hypothetical protein
MYFTATTDRTAASACEGLYQQVHFWHFQCAFNQKTKEHATATHLRRLWCCDVLCLACSWSALELRYPPYPSPSLPSSTQHAGRISPLVLSCHGQSIRYSSNKITRVHLLHLSLDPASTGFYPVVFFFYWVHVKEKLQEIDGCPIQII